jgi:predicted GIY-YIG superfamily endonuclease
MKKNDKKRGEVYMYTFNKNKLLKNHDLPDDIKREVEANHGKIYIGSTIDPNERHRSHKRAKEKNRFHKVIRDFGLDEAFDRTVLFEGQVQREELLRLEQQFLDKFKPYLKDVGFNTQRRTILNRTDINKVMNSGTPVALLTKDGFILKFYPTISDFARDFGVTPDGAYKALIEKVPTKASTLMEDYFLLSVTTLMQIEPEPIVGMKLNLDDYIEPPKQSRVSFQDEFFIAFVDEETNLVKVVVNSRKTARDLLGLNSKVYQNAVASKKPIKGNIIYEIPKSEYHLVKIGYSINYKFEKTSEVFYIYKNKVLVDVVLSLSALKRRTGLKQVKRMIDFKEEVNGIFIEPVNKLNGQKTIGSKLYENFRFDRGLIDYYKKDLDDKGVKDET